MNPNTASAALAVASVVVKHKALTAVGEMALKTLLVELGVDQKALAADIAAAELAAAKKGRAA